MAASTAILVVAAVSAATTAYASYETGRQQRKVGRANAKMLEHEAEQARYSAKVKAERYKREAARRMGQMRAGYAVSGVDVEGTPLLVLMESASEAAKDEERIRQGGEQQAWGLLSRANIQRIGGKGAYTAGAMGAGSSLLGGAARVLKG